MNIFRGVGVALITPFKNGKVDYLSFHSLCDELISRGVNALIVLGSTQEPHSLSPSEKAKLVKDAVSISKGNVPVIAGILTPNTKSASLQASIYENVGVDGLLVIPPYCSKCTDDGLLEHFRSIKKESGLPIIAYNVPSRIGYSIKTSLLSTLFDEKTIQAVKHASTSVEQAIEYKKSKIPLYVGNDDLTVPLRSIGADGTISVLALAIPEIVHSLLDLPITDAGRLQVEINSFVNALFSEVNPVGIKFLLSLLGKCQNELRLPLSTASLHTQEIIKNEATKIGLRI